MFAVEGANGTVAFRSVFTEVSADRTVAGIIESPFGVAVFTVEGADEAVVVTIAIVFAITMIAEADADGTFAFVATPATTLAVAVLAVADAATVTLVDIIGLIATIVFHFLKDRRVLNINFKTRWPVGNLL